MKLAYLKIEGYKGLDFEHEFKESGKIVITGINGSGKSTIIEVIEMLLSNQSQPNEQFTPRKITGEKRAVLHIKVSSNSEELNNLSVAIAENTPFKESEVFDVLAEVFNNDKYTLERKVIINREVPSQKWSIKADIIEEIGYFKDSTLGMNPNILNQLRTHLVKRISSLRAVNPPAIDKSDVKLRFQDLFGDDRDENQNRYNFDLNLNNYVNHLLQYTPSKEGEQNFDKILSSYSELLNPIKIIRGKSPNGQQDTVLGELNGNRFELSHLSTGQKQALTLVTAMEVWNKVSIKPVLLIDEPENGLHPNLVKNIFAFINNNFVADENTTVLVATHSSEVIAENPEDIYRIVKSGESISGLIHIQNLKERADLFKHLGVPLHINYVAQRLVFVESPREKKNSLNDDFIYQSLIDPAKENVYFILIPVRGSKSEVKKFTKVFKETIINELGGDSSCILSLVDRDNDKYELGKNTPYYSIEALYFFDLELTYSVLNQVTKKDIRIGKLKYTIGKLDPLKDPMKDTWDAVFKEWGLSHKANKRKEVEKLIVSGLRDSAKLPQLVKDFIAYYGQI